MLLFLLFSLNIFAQFPGNDNAPGGPRTFVVPAGVTSITAGAWGGGGGGGGSNNNNNAGSGGGGGGAVGNIIAVTPGDSFSYIVGNFGAAGAAATAGNGGNGTLSNIINVGLGINMIANPGTGGTGGNAVDVPGTGGTASGGTTSNGANGTAGNANRGAGGDSGTYLTIFGAGGAGGGTNAAGNPGKNPGGGGGGGEDGGGGTDRAGGAGAPGRVTFQYISVTNISPNPVCTGTTITITGSNFAAGATTVSINGTPCTGVVRVNATTITAVVAVGTTSGVVVITNPNGTNNGISITVNPSPAAIAGGAPTVCVSASTPAFTNVTAGGTWSITPGTGTASITPAGIVTGLTAGTVTVNYTVGSCSATAALTVDGLINTLATAPAPTDGATGVCYMGGGSITEVSWTAAAGAISYDVYFGTNPVPTFALNLTGTFYSVPTLLANTTYYWRIVPISACGVSTGSPITWSFTTSNVVCYCPSVPRNNGFNDGITQVQFNTINNITSANAGNEYTDYTGTQNTSVIRGSTHNLNVRVNTDGNFTQNQMAWIDWNQNGSFTDAGESYNLGTATNVANGLSSACPLSVNVPVTALLGTTRMRVSSKYNAYASSCDTGYDGEVEDYSVTVTAGAPCTAPTAQPTALVLTPGGTFINGSFTAAAPAPNNYLVIINTTGIAPTPTNGTNYTIGDNIGGTNVIVDTDSNTTFVAGQLSLSTTYYIYVFSYNVACTGGPLYNITAPLNGTTTTTAVPPTYCTPVTTSIPIDRIYVSRVDFVGTLLDTSNTSTTDGVPDGFQDFTGLPTKSIQAQGGPINMKLTAATGRGFWKVWVDWNKDGDFVDLGEEVYNPGGYMFISTTFGFVVPSNAAPGDYRMRIRVQNTIRVAGPLLETGVYFDSCNSFNPLVIGGVNYRTYGEAEDYLFTVIPKCDNVITSITNPPICGTGTATLSATGTASDIKWYDAPTAGTLLGTTASGANLVTPVLAATTTYYITSSNGTCETLVRTPVVIEVKPVPGLIIANPNPTICGENSIIQLDATGNNEVAYLINENFEGGSLGVFTNVNSDGTTIAQKGKTAWKNKTSIYIPNGNRWFPAITSGFGTNKFALTSMDDFNSVPLPTVPMENSLTLTTSVNPSATSFLNLTLTFKIFYSRYYADGVSPGLENCNVEVSTNGGGTWTTLPGGNLTADQGYGSSFVTLSYNLNAYIASNNLKIRIKVLGDGTGSGTAGDGAAIDDVKLFGDRPLTPFFGLGGGVDAFIDAPATIPYLGDQRNTIWIKPTLTQLEQASFMINVNANLNNGCTTSGTINVTNNTKIWKGTINTDWSNPGNWGPATVPTSANCVIIPSNTIVSGAGYNAYGRNLTVKSTGNLELQSNTNLTITEWIDINAGGIFNVRNNANLIQVNNVANIVNGTFNYQRDAFVDIFDYVYWSSPVNGFNSSNISTYSSNNYLYKWIPTIAGNGAGNFGNWVNGNEIMTTGLGYIERGLNSASLNSPVNFTATFTGTPNNGNITVPISRGTYNTVGTYPSPYSPTNADQESDNWNLLGNPYPSSISARDFLTANNTNLDGFIKVWRHGFAPSTALPDPFYNNYAYNYDANDYLIYNLSGPSTQNGFDGYIGAGQGFFTKMLHTSPTASSTAVFNNSMRNETYRNDQFYRNGNSNEGRIWLNLASSSSNRSILVAYVNGATNSKDKLYDAQADLKSTFNIYSLVDGYDRQVIQGRSVPFNQNDQVPIAIKVASSGEYSIGIQGVDGFFTNSNQNIYIEDKLANITHNLRQSPYIFTSNSGEFVERFVLKYSTNRLSVNENEFSNSVRIFANNTINVNSKNQNIKQVIVFDILGKEIYNLNDINKQDVSIANIKKTNSVLLVKTVLENGVIVSEKVIY